MEAFRDKSPGSDVGEEDVALSGSLVFRNVGLNLIGQVTPLLAGVIAIPLLIDGIGTDAFGVLAIAWMFVGSFSLFDLGLSRALTQLVADRLGTGRKREVPALVWTTLALTLLIGLIGGAGLALLAPWITLDLLNMPDALRHPALQATYAIAAGVPIIVSAANLRGVLEALQCFDVVNAAASRSGSPRS